MTVGLLLFFSPFIILLSAFGLAGLARLFAPDILEESADLEVVQFDHSVPPSQWQPKDISKIPAARPGQDRE